MLKKAIGGWEVKFCLGYSFPFKALQNIVNEISFCMATKPEAFSLVWYVALSLNSTAMVMSGQSVHLTTLFPGQS